MAKKKPYKIAVLDYETDPFSFGRVPMPFACEIYCDAFCEVFWGDDCVEKTVMFLESLEDRYMIYAHNGGKFDFHLMNKYLENPIKIINARIVQAQIGKHILRDSLAIIPVPLKAFDKDDIDYRKMERHCREAHKPEILRYLHKDCTSLYLLVVSFVERFTAKLTVGSTAMTELIKLHDFEIMKAETDKMFRPFYFGGRVECFRHGIIEGPLKILDVNSSYPDTMKNKKHPLSASFDVTEKLPDNFDIPYFAVIEATNRGALPVKDDDESLSFNVGRGLFHVCSHELEVALKYDLVKIHKVHKCFIPHLSGTFAEFVDTFYQQKVECKERGDKIGEMFAKFMLNSAYGKFASNPEHYKDWYINHDFGNDLTLIANGYSLGAEFDEFELWSKPATITDTAYYNVATAASITSGARATLLEGIQQAVDPIYCDTDSLLCREFRGEVSETTLGAWKLEKEAPKAAIAGKKLYALYDPKTLKKPKTIYNEEWKTNDPNPERRALKMASKGGNLSVDDIIAICNGDVVRYQNAAPTFSLHGEPKFIERNFRMTVDDDNEIAL